MRSLLTEHHGSYHLNSYCHLSRFFQILYKTSDKELSNLFGILLFSFQVQNLGIYTQNRLVICSVQQQEAKNVSKMLNAQMIQYGYEISNDLISVCVTNRY